MHEAGEFSRPDSAGGTGRTIRREEMITRRLEFETLITDLSARLVTSPLAAIDGEIERSLAGVREFFGADRCGLLRVSETKGDVWLSHASYAEGIDRVSGEINLGELFPWSRETLLTGRQAVVIARLDQLPPEAGRDRESFAGMGVKSALTIPLPVGNTVRYLFAMNFLRENADWPEELIPRLRLLGEIFVTALERRHADQVCRESEARLGMAAEAAGIGFWLLDPRSGYLWATDQAWALFGVTPGEGMDFGTVLALIHPDDREEVRQAALRAVESEEETSAEYRVVRSDGSVRWLISRGRQLWRETNRSLCLMGVTIDITERKLMEEQLRSQVREIGQLREQLERENVYLRAECDSRSDDDQVIGSSAVFRQVLARAEQVAGTGTTVLIQGETGTGKEVIARLIHQLSPRGKRVMVTVNCASLPAALVESELFGREKGAFTGAMTRQQGRFELADGSTIFLDEIGELSLETQAKLLRVLQEGTFERLGSPRALKVDVRVIAATNRNLAEEVRQGRFREDLYYRLNVFPLTVPPLRERFEDIPQLVWGCVKELSDKMGKIITKIPKREMDALKSYPWPGNIRELRNVIEHAMIVSRGETLTVTLPEHTGRTSPATITLEELERRHISGVLEATAWRVKGENGAAQLLGLNPTTLFSRMKRLGIPLRNEKF